MPPRSKAKKTTPKKSASKRPSLKKAVKKQCKDNALATMKQIGLERGFDHLIAPVRPSMICAIADKIYAVSEGHVMAEITERDQIKPEVCEKYL